MRRVVTTAAADFGNAIATASGSERFACINADLTITLHRLPEGEWVRVEPSIFPEASSTSGPTESEVMGVGSGAG